MNILNSWKQQELRKINALFNSSQQLITLVDGSMVIVLSEDENWLGKQITLEDGTILQPGEYTTASGMHSSGRIIKVGEDGLIKSVRPVESKPSAMYHEPITAESFKKSELAKLPQNQKLRQQRIQDLEKKIEGLKTKWT